MSMTTRKCLSIMAWAASLLFCGLLSLSAYAAAMNKAAPERTTSHVINP